MFSLQVKLIAAAILLTLIGLAGWRVNVWRNGYLERDQAVKQLKEAQDTFNANVERLSKAAETNRQIASDLAAFRNEQTDFSQSFRDELSKRNITKEIRYVTKDGETVTCTQRDPARYLELFNSAVSGTANP